MSDSTEPIGFVAPDPADLAPLFPGYEIESLIATGGMGAVYCAVQKSLDRTVALKILPMEFSQDAAFCAGFEAEAKAMARLNHPNLIGVYDFGSVNGMLYIIMEYVPGKSIYHSAYGKAIDPQEAIRLVTGICNGLAHAHENGILHRDIKPSNILLDLNAEPKIGDFGLARPLGSQIEEGEEIFGTPHYTAPEVVDNPHSVDYRADIFSVGVLLHELLTGRLPADDPRTASAIVRCDPRFDAIIRKATQPLPAARYTSAAEIAKDLQAIVTSAVPKAKRGAAVPGHRVAPRARAYSRPTKKKSSGGLFLVFLMAAAAAGAVVFVLNSKKPTEEETPQSNVPILSTQDGDSEADAASANVDSRPDTWIPPSSGNDQDSSQVGENSSSVVPETTLEETTTPAETPGATADVPAPQADVDAFFARAHDIMRDKARYPIAALELGLKENFSGYLTSINRQLARYRPNEGPEKEDVEEVIAEWKEEGTRLPDDLDSSLAEFPELQQLHDEYLLKQAGVVDTYGEEISKLSALYIVGLQKQVERYQAANDPGAVHLVEKEIATTRAESDHFTTEVLGISDED